MIFFKRIYLNLKELYNDYRSFQIELGKIEILFSNKIKDAGRAKVLIKNQSKKYKRKDRPKFFKSVHRHIHYGFNYIGAINCAHKYMIEGVEDIPDEFIQALDNFYKGWH